MQSEQGLKLFYAKASKIMLLPINFLEQFSFHLKLISIQGIFVRLILTFLKGGTKAMFMLLSLQQLLVNREILLINDPTPHCMSYFIVILCNDETAFNEGFMWLWLHTYCVEA